jgi:hypothetical protein
LREKNFPSINSANFSNFIVEFCPNFLTPKKCGGKKKEKKKPSIDV